MVGFCRSALRGYKGLTLAALAQVKRFFYLVRKAVQQAVSACRSQIRLRTAPGLMCRVPGGVTAALAIEVTKHRATLAAARPVVAGVIVSIGEECRAVGHDASENIVPVCRVAPTKYAIAIIIERSASDDIGSQV